MNSRRDDKESSATSPKTHRYTEQTFGLCGRRRGWDVSREQHWNMYIIKGETAHQPRLDAWDKCLGLAPWEDPEGSGREGGGRGESGWGTHVNPWLIHVTVWQKPLQYCKVISLQLIKINGKKKSKWVKTESESVSCSVMSDSLRPHGLYPTRLLCPWDSPGKDWSDTIG